MCNAIQPPHRPRGAGFTLVELLVVIGVMAVLAGILLPAIAVVRDSAKGANTEALLGRVELALAAFRQEHKVYPPDYVAAQDCAFVPHILAGVCPDDSPDCVKWVMAALPPETLFYFLTNPFVTAKEAYLKLREGSESMDYNKNGLPEIVDAYGWPLLYNRAKYPGRPYNHYNYAGPAQDSQDYEAPDHKPWHNKDSVDLYSVGRDGKTGGHADRVDPGPQFATYVANAMKANGYPGNSDAGPTCGTEADDLNNW